MKRALLCAMAIAFAMGMSAMAQDKMAKPAGGQDKMAKPQEHTMSGCVAKAGDGFTVTNTAEKGPKTIGVVSSTANLGPHVGHKVDITGTAVPTKEAESMKPAPPKADHYMKLTAVKMVSATCP